MSAFQSMQMDEAQLARAAAVRAAYEQLQATLGANLPPGRYAALATTELEASCMWSIKAISHESPNRRQELGPSSGDSESVPQRPGLS